jgi:hypothetical protein
MLGVSQPIRQPDAGSTEIEKVDLQIRAYNNDGRLAASTSMRADVAVRPGASGLAEYEVHGRLDLKPGRYQLRTAANVGALTTSGSLYYDLDVPDFIDAQVSLSGVVLTAEPALAVGGIKPMLPVTPTVLRRFGTGMQAAAFFRVYTGGRKPLTAVPVRIRLRNASDVVVLDRREQIEGASFSMQRSANVNIALPVGRLAAGPYLLTVESATGSQDVSRTIRFEVTR